MSGFLKFLLALLVLAIVVASYWFYFTAPCKDFQYVSGKDVPGRCLIH